MAGAGWHATCGAAGSVAWASASGGASWGLVAEQEEWLRRVLSLGDGAGEDAAVLSTVSANAEGCYSTNDGFDGRCSAAFPPASDGAAASGRDSGEATRQWRCLCALHPPPCASCTLPPSEDEEPYFEFVGDVGKKNGEKRLRSGISRTPEWSNITESSRVADLAEARGTSGGLRLAAAIRSRRVAELRKTHILFLCRTWGYKSDLWRRRDARKEYRASVDAVAACPRQLQLPSQPAPPPPAALPLLVQGQGWLEQELQDQKRKFHQQPQPPPAAAAAAELRMARSPPQQTPAVPWSSTRFLNESADLLRSRCGAVLDHPSAAALQAAQAAPVPSQAGAAGSMPATVQPQVLDSLYALAMESCRLGGEAVSVQMSLQSHLTQDTRSRLLADREGSIKGSQWILRFNEEALRATRDALPPPGSPASTECALMTLGTRPGPMDQFFWTLQSMVGAHRESIWALTRSMTEDLDSVPQQLTQLADEYAAKFDRSMRNSMLLIGHMQVLHAQARLGSAAEYLTVVQQLSQVCRAHSMGMQPLLECSATSLKACGAQSGLFPTRSPIGRLALLPVPTAERLMSADTPLLDMGIM